jgi:uncharacterized protein involved in exopolysaccharide biosynthesis
MEEPTHHFLEVEKMKWQSTLVLSVLVLLTILVITAIWIQVIPQYQASAEVRVRPIIPHLVFRTEDNGRIPRYRSFVNTQISIIRSSAILQRVLDQPEVQQTQWFKNPPKSLVQRLSGNTPSPMERLKDHLTVQPRRRTEIIDVSFMAASDKDAKLIVNTVLDQYITYIGRLSDARTDALYRQLVDQYKSLENEILGRANITAELRRTLGTGTPEELISGKRVRLDETQARLDQVRQSIALLEWEMNQAITDDSNEAAIDTNDKVEYQLARSKREEQLLDAELKKQQREFAVLFENAQLLEKENNALQRKRELFSAVRGRVDQKTMERNVPGPIEILTRAVTPSEPYGDRRVLFTVIAIFLCLGMGGSMVFLQRTRIGKGDKSQKK